MSGEKNSSALDAMVSANNMKQTANADLGITQEYNKQNRDKLWDSTKGKQAYKEKTFGDKQTVVDPITGKTLHKNQSAAQNKYHMKNSDGENISSKWADHSAETDHVNALKDVHEKVKGNPFLTDEDFKDITNSDENYRLLSKSDNASKGEKSDWQIITDKDSGLSTEGKIQMAKEKITSDVALTGKFAARTAQNAGKEFVSGATDTLVNSAIPLTTEAVRKLVNVAQGKESLGDAAKDMGKITVNVAVAGGTNKLLVDVVTSQMANSSSAILQNIASSNEVAQIIAVAAIVQESAVKYINGEIDGKEFIEEVGVKGATMVAGMIGGQVGREIGGIIGAVVGTVAIPIPGVGTGVGYVAGEVIGQVLGVIITTVSCSAIVSVYNTSKHLNDYKLKEAQIRRLETDALQEMENQRCKFREIVEHEYKVWDETIQSGFDQILRSACEETYNLQGVTDGLDKILSVFGKKVKFSSMDEYENQLDMPLKLSF
nr:GlsB/YeaQ/YmgE family stress response membrane protein [uncultured Anaerosporobacter sp.]